MKHKQENYESYDALVYHVKGIVASLKKRYDTEEIKMAFDKVLNGKPMSEATAEPAGYVIDFSGSSDAAGMLPYDVSFTVKVKFTDYENYDIIDDTLSVDIDGDADDFDVITENVLADLYSEDGAGQIKFAIANYLDGESEDSAYEAEESGMSGLLDNF